MGILLHICCAPCAIAAIEELNKTGREVSGFFYNPNIHPYSEYLRRRSEVEKYSKETGLSVVYPGYEIENYFQHIVYNEAFPPNPNLKQLMADPPLAEKTRCPVCWRLRLEKAGRFAKENSFDSFTTTLLASPYQDQDAIRGISADLAKRLGVEFYYKDFRPSFKEAHNIAKSKGMYCQNYCGCVFSEKERIEKKKVMSGQN